MGIQYSVPKIHWNYFLALEQDLIQLSRYIEPCADNDETYSIELARLIMSAAQEIDVLLKIYCKNIDSESSARSIEKYYKVISSKQAELLNEVVFLDRFSIKCEPFSSWEPNKPPLWWTANNKIKHHRSSHYNQATLKNALNSMAALLIVTLYFYKGQIQKDNQQDIDWVLTTKYLNPSSNLLRMPQRYYAVMEW